MLKLFFLAGLLSSAVNASADAEKFDYVCSGIETEGILLKTETKFKERIKINLNTMQWCKASCFYVEPIQSASADLLVLGDKLTRSSTYREAVDTTEKTYYFSTMSLRIPSSIKREGQCKVEEFSGFGK